MAAPTAAAARLAAGALVAAAVLPAAGRKAAAAPCLVGARRVVVGQSLGARLGADPAAVQAGSRGAGPRAAAAGQRLRCRHSGLGGAHMHSSGCWLLRLLQLSRRMCAR